MLLRLEPKIVGCLMVVGGSSSSFLRGFKLQKCLSRKRKKNSALIDNFRFFLLKAQLIYFIAFNFFLKKPCLWSQISLSF
jgi:hypothetical protein